MLCRLRHLYVVLKNKIKNVLKRKKNPQTGTLSVSGNKIDLESADITVTTKGIPGFLVPVQRMGHVSKNQPQW